jgi:lysozyme family protein
MQHPFKALEQEYAQRLASLKITRGPEIHARAVQILKGPAVANFQPVHAELEIPMVWMICSFERESGLDFRTSPAQGDRWDKVSVNVPRGVGPFKNFVDAAIWSYHYDGIDRNSSPWSWPYLCWAWEKFNGFGPRDHGRVSGYVWSGTDQYTGGKYVSDGHWDASARDQQLGCVGLALELVKLEPSLGLDESVPTIPDIPTPIPVTPTPPAVSGGSHGVAWLQQSLNKVIAAELVVDGSYGRRTRNAVRLFQARQGITADGLFGPITEARLQRELDRLGPGGSTEGKIA